MMPDPTADQLTIQHLRLEVARLEHALASRELLAAMLAPKPSLYLPPRDRDVLVRLCMGDSSEEIGQALFITAATVKTHLDGLSKRFGTHNRVGTAMAAIRAGFTPDQDQQEVST